MKSYRLELENNKGKFIGAMHFKSLKNAERALFRHKRMIDFEINAIPNNKRYGTIWESELDTWRE